LPDVSALNSPAYFHGPPGLPPPAISVLRI
jgi:hypothetical protein